MHLICPHPQILNNLCFSFLLGITAVPRETESNAYAKFLGENKVHYSRYAKGVCQALGQRKQASSENASKQITESLCMRVEGCGFPLFSLNYNGFFLWTPPPIRKKKYYVEIFFNYELVLFFMKHENTLLSLIRLFTKISIMDHWFARYTSYNT